MVGRLSQKTQYHLNSSLLVCRNSASVSPNPESLEVGWVLSFLGVFVKTKKKNWSLSAIFGLSFVCVTSGHWRFDTLNAISRCRYHKLEKEKEKKKVYFASHLLLKSEEQ